MPGRDDGEFELILGNKQLLSVLFIVIVLLGVFFAMGFLAGRTTGVSPTVAQNKAERQPLTVESASNKPPVVTSEPDSTPAKADRERAPEPKARETRREEPKREEPKPPAKPEPAKPAPAPRPAAGGYTANPPAGSYLQAAATRRAEAETMLSVITSKTGLSGYVAPHPTKADLFRVLIGPLSKERQADARVKLNDMGVKTPYPVTY